MASGLLSAPGNNFCLSKRDLRSLLSHWVTGCSVTLATLEKGRSPRSPWSAILTSCHSSPRGTVAKASRGWPGCADISQGDTAIGLTMGLDTPEDSALWRRLSDLHQAPSH